ncbi:MAG TPA: hypothetical protein VNQ90_02915 [Chthoniobacteraceae bacterium]|nr:hypothetical protein [Chthoniobacteraceae bacterium]
MLDRVQLIGSCFGVAIASTATGAIANVISRSTQVSLADVITVGAVIVLGTWRMSAQLSSIKNELRTLNRRIEQIEKKEQE